MCKNGRIALKKTARERCQDPNGMFTQGPLPP